MAALTMYLPDGVTYDAADLALRRILLFRLIDRADASLKGAADSLGMHRRQVYRWCQQIALAETGRSLSEADAAAWARDRAVRERTDRTGTVANRHTSAVAAR